MSSAPLTEEEELRLPKADRGGRLSRHPPHGTLFYDRPDSLERIRKLELRSDDVWVVTPPKCGTTWAQEIVWRILNGADARDERHQFYRFPFLETECRRYHRDLYPEGEPEDDHHLEQYLKHSISYVERMPQDRLRLIKSHLPLSMLPRHLLDTCRVVFVARNLKDAAVSFFHHLAVENPELKERGFRSYARDFKDGLIPYTPFLPMILEAWNLSKTSQNLHFMTYEGLKRDFEKEAKRLCRFLDADLGDEDLTTLEERTSFATMSADPTLFPCLTRRGEVGDWKGHFDAGTDEEWDRWIGRQLEGSGLRMELEI